MKNWPDYFIEHAQLLSTKSKDPSTKVGVVITDEDNTVLSTGFNGFARGVREMAVESCKFCNGTGSRRGRSMEVLGEEGWCPACTGTGMVISDTDICPVRWARPEKYLWVSHAEQNAIANAARVGIKLKGSILYMNYSPTHICEFCAVSLIQAGVMRWVGPDTPFPSPNAEKIWKGGPAYKNSPVHAMAVEAGVEVEVLPFAV